MQITRRGQVPASPGNPDWFTGDVAAIRHDSDLAGSRLSMAVVTFQPGARTNWHTHPLGQTLVVTEGEGWVQTEGGPKEAIGVGDVIRFDPDTRHWHGATTASAMTYIAIQEAVDGVAVDWQEPVSEADYSGP